MDRFSERLKLAQKRTGGCLCVGLDVDLERLPDGITRDAEGALLFCRSIVEATHSFAAAYKPNLAFFEALGEPGFSVLDRLRASVPAELLFIADAKRGDIGNTSQAYAKAFYKDLRCDAITLSPYMGKDTVDPFLEYEGTCSFILGLTSNPSSADFQLLELKSGEKLYEKVAKTAVEWGKGRKGEIGLVVGATQTQHLKGLRKLAPKTLFLVPGVGTQGGDLEAVLQEGKAEDGAGLLVNVSRQVLYASAKRDYAEAARREAEKLVAQMKKHFG